MAKRRTRMDIIAAILEAALDGDRKTHIMYRSSLNFKLIEEFLTSLINRGLIEQVGSEYRTTDKGKTYLKSYREMVELFR